MSHFESNFKLSTWIALGTGAACKFPGADSY